MFTWRANIQTISRTITGPSVAPAVSIARWKPNARPRLSGSVVSAISTSRGALRIPLPNLSANRIPSTSGQEAAIMSHFADGGVFDSIYGK
jgi:hypothetical protein